ncbi:hypothetical protein [Streptomyces cadmiisoli]|uniref:hypothetical protein n=1 Tax=Streptomyces cadmiisoli TaxID=2184053 RepID=UPI003D71C8DD
MRNAVSQFDQLIQIRVTLWQHGHVPEAADGLTSPDCPELGRLAHTGEVVKRVVLALHLHQKERALFRQSSLGQPFDTHAGVEEEDLFFLRAVCFQC